MSLLDVYSFPGLDAGAIEASFLDFPGGIRGM